MQACVGSRDNLNKVGQRCVGCTSVQFPWPLTTPPPLPQKKAKPFLSFKCT
uniref:Uncharacterized protein n=1 Tax=Anguilla anguilla TaxID=7936 RepID=A0A0E9UI93_ANGAN